MSTLAPAILWFRHELRLDDLPALRGALASRRPLVPVYVLDTSAAGARAAGGASRWWLHHSLLALAADIAARGGRLVLRRGPTAAILARLVRETGAAALYFTRAYEPGDLAVEARLRESLESRVELRRFGGRLLFEPEEVCKRDGEPYRVFAPFWRSCQARGEPGAAAPPPTRWPGPSRWPDSEALAAWCLLPTRPDWAGGLREHWQPGESGAARALDDFLATALRRYPTDRDRPDLRGTSRLSPHLHFGEISPRRVWHAVRAHAAVTGGEQGVAAFLRELAWRDFSYHLLHRFPELPRTPLRPEFAAFPWVDDAPALRRWQRGETGFPIVDAGMRELWATGWMHNRVRMIVASFLVKDLRLAWQHGETWFWDTLVDADLANNAASWQWVAGCGADAAPYFRIFNPVLQGRKFDPDGHYVRRWVPELAAVADQLVHEPWKLPRPPADYPAPMVDHAVARREALTAFESLRRT